mmetsp:Transcript_38062/g.94422  ORF Transcript_38062/g.94422 Transcript_38062/m.94422 type:complete len:309 (-) Transcript_38062:486-1412(-)
MSQGGGVPDPSMLNALAAQSGGGHLQVTFVPGPQQAGGMPNNMQGSMPNGPNGNMHTMSMNVHFPSVQQQQRTPGATNMPFPQQRMPSPIMGAQGGAMGAMPPGYPRTVPLRVASASLPQSALLANPATAAQFAAQLQPPAMLNLLNINQPVSTMGRVSSENTICDKMSTDQVIHSAILVPPSPVAEGTTTLGTEEPPVVGNSTIADIIEASPLPQEEALVIAATAVVAAAVAFLPSLPFSPRTKAMMLDSAEADMISERVLSISDEDGGGETPYAPPSMLPFNATADAPTRISTSPTPLEPATLPTL